jgi:Tfp pilus assembly protein FimT
MERQKKDRLPASWMKQSWMGGFTYFELIIVLLLLSILAMIGLPALNVAMDDVCLSGAAQEVVNALEFAQLTAMTSGRDTKVIFRPLLEKISVKQFEMTADLFTGGNGLVASDVENGTFELMDYPMNKGIEYQVIFSNETRFQGVDMIASAIGHDGETVSFNTLGIPSGGGTVTLGLDSRQMVVSLDAMTGKVTVIE